jgi:lysine-N-methylase
MEPDPLNGVYVYLDIVGDFVCQQCGACCNNDWLVTVDEAGYQRNQRLFEQAGRSEEFAQAFLPLGSEAELGEYARISKQPSGGCWFLTAENLCRLQQVAGHQHLDTVCQWFPRYPMNTERGVELSLSFSCPAAVKMAVRQQPLQIVRAEVSPIGLTPVEFVRHVYPGQQQPQSILRYYFELEGHLIDLLQARRLSLPERLELVQRSLHQIDTWQDPAEFGRRLNQLFRDNYARVDAVADAEAAGGNPSEWLVENTYVNFLFRKNLYVNGIAKCLAQLERMGQKIIPCMEQSALAGETAELEQLIVALELQWNHNSRRQEK